VAFRYRLESLLRLQRGIERQEENRLLACVAHIAGLTARLHEWELSRITRQNAACAECAQGAPAAVLQQAVEWDRAAGELERNIRGELIRAEADRQKQLQKYQAARQKREILESLRDRQESEYRNSQLREMQEVLDEAFLLRLFHAQSH